MGEGGLRKPSALPPIFSSYKLICLCVLKIYAFSIYGCMSVHRVYAILEKATRGRQMPPRLGLDSSWVLGTETSPLEENPYS